VSIVLLSFLLQSTYNIRDFMSMDKACGLYESKLSIRSQKIEKGGKFYVHHSSLLLEFLSSILHKTPLLGYITFLSRQMIKDLVSILLAKHWI
jgi:hypothetical protein